MTPVKTGRKARKPNFWKPSKRQEIVKKLFADLDEWERDKAPAYIAQLMATHDNYHGRNPLLIAMQDEHATDVDSYNAWTERGRRPMGSGYSIRIVRPHRWHEQDEQGNDVEHVRGYDYFPVFDIRHTIEDPDEMINHQPTPAMLAWRAAHPDGKW